MIVPVRCFTCGNVLADKELAYRAIVNATDTSSEQFSLVQIPFVDDVQKLLSRPDTELKSTQGKVLDMLGVTKMCCRRHMLSSVDVLEDI